MTTSEREYELEHYRREDELDGAKQQAEELEDDRQAREKWALVHENR